MVCTHHLGCASLGGPWGILPSRQGTTLAPLGTLVEAVETTMVQEQEARRGGCHRACCRVQAAWEPTSQVCRQRQRQLRRQLGRQQGMARCHPQQVQGRGRRCRQEAPAQLACCLLVTPSTS